MIITTNDIEFIIEVNPPSTFIQKALEYLLQVPDERVKPKIIEEIINHYTIKLNTPNYRVAIFIAYRHDIPIGMVATQIDPEYRTYSRKATTFSWLLCEDFETCKALMKCVENFAKENKLKKIRGPINYPKIVGGIGIQTEGFDAPIMNGINFNHPNSQILSYLNELGYESESKYNCVEVVSKQWGSGNRLDPEYFIRYFSVEQMRGMKSEIMKLAENSFYSILADAPGGESRFEEMMRSYELASVMPFKEKLAEQIIKDHGHISEFIEAWNSCDLRNIICWAPCAFKRDSGELVGIILSLPNLYQLWAGEPFSRANVDTAMVHKDHSGKGIFSSLNNSGWLTVGMYGITSAEGTTIWANNEKAIKTIFPHSEPLRTHFVVQKRVK
jgi:hypothetical protein